MNGAAAGSTTDFYNITLAQDADFVLAVLYDISNSTSEYPTDGIQVSSGASSASIAIPDSDLDDNDVDYAFFRVTGAAGEVITVSALSTGGGLVGLGGLGFEAVPVPLTDYESWSLLYPGADLTDPDGDFDGDTLRNDYERLFGLDPTSGSSVNPFAVPLDAAGTFSYTRRDDDLTGMHYTIWYSTNLENWFEDFGAVQIPGTPDGKDIETVAVTISSGLLAGRGCS